MTRAERFMQQSDADPRCARVLCWEDIERRASGKCWSKVDVRVWTPVDAQVQTQAGRHVMSQVARGLVHGRG